MAKLDRLGWKAGLSLVSYGVRMGIRVSDPSVLDAVVPRLPPGWRPSSSSDVKTLYSLLVGGEGPRSGVRRLHLAYAGSQLIARTRDLDDALAALESDLRLHVAELARRRVFVHAGVVGWRGRAILIPGRSGAGKSSLVAALARRGATYYSDEYAVLDARGRVHPYPAPLSLRDPEGWPTTRLSAEILGGPGRRPLRVGLVAVTQYRPGARWRPHPLSPGETLLELLAQTVPARSRPGAALATLDQLVRKAFGIRGARGEAAETIEALLDLVEGLPRASAHDDAQEEDANGAP